MSDNKLESQKLKEIFHQNVSKIDDYQVLDYNEAFLAFTQLGLQNNLKENEKLYKQFLETKYKQNKESTQKQGLNLQEFIDLVNKIYQDQIMHEINLQQFQVQRPLCFYALNNGVFKIAENVVSLYFKKNYQGEEVKDEIELIIEKVKQGYSINCSQNLKIIQSEISRIESNNDINSLTQNQQQQYDQYIDLSNFWEWICKCLQQKKDQQQSGYINYQNSNSKHKLMIDPALGLRNILELEKEQSNKPQVNQMYSHFVFESGQRLQCLQICGWQDLYITYQNRYEVTNTAEKKLVNYLDKLVAENRHSKAVAIAVFHFDFIKAYEYVQKIHKKDDDSISFMKAILRGLESIQSTLEKDQNLKQMFYQKKIQNEFDIKKQNIFDVNSINEILEKQQEKQPNIQFIAFLLNTIPFIKSICQTSNFKDPYFKAICSFINNNYEEIIQEKRISLFDKLAFAIRFYESKKLEQLLNQLEENAKNEGVLGVLQLSGQQNQTSQEIIQKYIDQKNDIQTIALACIYFKMFKTVNEGVNDGQSQGCLQIWYSSYKNILNRTQLFEERANMDREYNNLIDKYLSSEQKLKNYNQTSQIVQKCNYCNSKNDHKNLIQKLGSGTKGQTQFGLGGGVQSNLEKTLLQNCPKCQKPFPKCEICLLPISIMNPYFEIDEKRKGNKQTNRLSIYQSLDLNEALVWCINCKHGGHYKHITDWFMIHFQCPVSDCNCQCSHL